jgi:hypothetical protein
MVISGSCQESVPSTQERSKQMRRKRFQKGSLQTRSTGVIACGLFAGGRTEAGGPRSWGVARR